MDLGTDGKAYAGCAAALFAQQVGVAVCWRCSVLALQHMCIACLRFACLADVLAPAADSPPPLATRGSTTTFCRGSSRVMRVTLQWLRVTCDMLVAAACDM